MDNCRCFFPSCQNQPKGYCDCTHTDVYMCLDHQFEHFKKKSDQGHNWIDLEIIRKNSIIAQKLSVYLNELYISKQNAIKKAADISNLLMNSLSLLLDKITKTIETTEFKISEITKANKDKDETVLFSDSHEVIKAWEISIESQTSNLKSQIAEYFEWSDYDQKFNESGLIRKTLIDFSSESVKSKSDEDASGNSLSLEIDYSKYFFSKGVCSYLIGLDKKAKDLDYLECKIVVVGDPNVGKSQIFAHVYKDFKLATNLSYGIEYTSKSKQLKSGKIANLQIWDDADLVRFFPSPDSKYHTVRGVFIIYDVTDALSFTNVKQLIDAFNIYADPDKKITIMLIGNKKDLTAFNPAERKVTTETAMIFARNNGLLFAEISAYNVGEVQQAFNILVEEIYN